MLLKKSDLIEIYIDNLAYGGEGIGRYDGLTVFVADSVPGDKLLVEITTINKSFARGTIKEIIEPSEYRVKPACPLSKVCGGCQWLHIDYNEQLKAKKKIVEENLKKIAHLEIPILDVIKSEYNIEYRCKIQYPVQQTKVSKRVLAGYYRKGTHEIVNIKHCPVQPEIISTITQFLRDKIQELGLTAYNEKTKKGLIRHLVYRYSYSKKNLLVIIVINSKVIPVELSQLCKMLQENFNEVIGVLANFNTLNSNLIMSYETELICDKDFIEENLEGRKFKISAGSFFQVNPVTAVKMFDAVHKIIEEKTVKPSILDVYAGVGSFAIWLKDLASRITAVEENPNAINDALENIKLNAKSDEPEIKIIKGNADNVVQNLASENQRFEVTILDPPRKGCSEEVLKAAVNITDRLIIYVSCNPSTLARDLKFLKENGFIPEYVQPVDMFCHTYHIESIVVLNKQYY